MLAPKKRNFKWSWQGSSTSRPASACPGPKSEGVEDVAQEGAASPFVGSGPHFPALDLMKGLADPSCATSSTPSLFGPGHALAGRELLQPCQLPSRLRFFA